MPFFDGTGPRWGGGAGRGCGPCRFFNFRCPMLAPKNREELSNYRQALEEELKRVKKEEEAL